MKDQKLFSAMGNIDGELIDEALNVPKKKKLPLFRITAAAAVFVLIASVTIILVSINKQPKNITGSDTSDIQASEKTENIKPESKEKKDEGTTTAKTNESTPAVKSSDPEQPAASTSEAQAGEQTSAVLPAAEDESNDMLGFIIKDGKSYMQVFDNSEYTLDKDIGRAGEFSGAYNGLEDNSKVYTVKENDKILIVKFESGGSVTLMLWDDNVMDSMGYYRFRGLRVDASVMAALSSNDGKAYFVYVTRPDSDDMYDYVYSGKTLRQMKEELEESWKTEHGKYNPLEEEYQTALHTFLKEKIKTVYDILTSKGIEARLINEVRCEMTMTKEQFEDLAASRAISDEYAFGLSAGYYPTDDDPYAE